MTIRKATQRETQKIIKHSLNVLKESSRGYVTENAEKAYQMTVPFLESGGYYLVYVDKNKIRGWIAVGKVFSEYTDEMVGIFPEIYVFPKYRRNGIAEQLCYEAFKHLKSEGYQKVQLNVFEGNHSRLLCEKLGFKEISRIMEKEL